MQSGLFATSIDVDVARRLMVDAFAVEGSERTLCREVRRLQAGHLMWLRKGRLEIRRWWRTVDHLPALPKTEAERVEHFRELFQDAVALRMRSDVPIGTCLSGGFDSSAVLCTMAGTKRRDGPARQCCLASCLCCDISGRSQRRKARGRASRRMGEVDPTFLEIGPNDALRDLERILEDMDDVYIGSAKAGMVDLPGTSPAEGGGVARWPWRG